MRTREEAISDTIFACAAVSWAEELLELSRRRRDEEIRKLHSEQSIPKTRMADKLQMHASLLGYTEDEISAFGISSWSVRNLLDNPPKRGDNS